MRLIDADALPVSKEYCVDEAGWGATFCVVHKDAIDNAPTIDPESLRPKGRWEVNKEYGDYECSVCKSGDITALHFSQLRMNYCPNCGAEMEGE